MSTNRTLEQVARGLTAQAVSEMLARRGMAAPAPPPLRRPAERKAPGRPRRPRAESVALAAGLREQGRTNEAIAQALGLSVAYIRELLPPPRRDRPRAAARPAPRQPRTGPRRSSPEQVEKRRRDTEFALDRRRAGWTVALIAGALDRSPYYMKTLLPPALRPTLDPEGRNARFRTDPICAAMRSRGPKVVR